MGFLQEYFDIDKKKKHTHIHHYRPFKVTSLPNLRVFGLSEEARVSKENRRRQFDIKPFSSPSFA